MADPFLVEVSTIRTLEDHSEALVDNDPRRDSVNRLIQRQFQMVGVQASVAA